MDLFVFQFCGVLGVFFPVNGFRISLLCSVFSSSLVSDFLLVEIQFSLTCKMLVTLGFSKYKVAFVSLGNYPKHNKVLLVACCTIYYISKNSLPPLANVQP